MTRRKAKDGATRGQGRFVGTPGHGRDRPTRVPRPGTFPRQRTRCKPSGACQRRVLHIGGGISLTHAHRWRPFTPDPLIDPAVTILAGVFAMRRLTQLTQ